MAVTALLKLAGFTNNWRYGDIAHQALAQESLQGLHLAPSPFLFHVE